VVDQLPAAAEDPGEPLRLGDPQREVPHPLGISPVGAVEAGRADLRAWWAVEQLGGGGVHAVVEVPGQQHPHGVAVAAQDLVQVGAQRDRLGGTQVQRVGAEPGPLPSSRGWNRPPGKVSSLDFKCAEMMVRSWPPAVTVTCSAPRPMSALVGSGAVGLSSGSPTCTGANPAR